VGSVDVYKRQRYSLPNDLDTTGQILISQLKSLDFKERKLKKIESLPLQDMAKIDQIIEYISVSYTHL
ncbi:type II toxin-antitoxin system PemK/MazF family toxin, partial [Enterococcus sp. S181_ASV_20]|nr:type II toxin-antitoxin system PemK/MazF family toxin [Enterococcus sp. S181_ASV_20]